ncbi:MAG: deoxyribonuclease IV [Solirubrobacterales bacterium]
MKPKIGAHLSVGKGLKATVDTAAQWGAEACQMFARNPRGSAARQWTQDEIDAFTGGCQKNAIYPVVVHIPYIVNPAAERDDLYELAARIVVEDMIRCDLIGASYLVLHPGSRGAQSPEQAVERLIALINDAMARYDGDTVLLIETMAGMGKELGANPQELEWIIGGIQERGRIGVCLDTCHLYAAGFDMATPAGVDAAYETLAQSVGRDAIRLVHVNDSKKELGSRVDRHAPIGKGFIGLEGFQALMAHPFLGTLPMILETPEETMQEDLNTLKALRDKQLKTTKKSRKES